MTHSDSISTTSQSRLPMTDSPAEPPEEHKDQSPAFTFHPLRQMSQHLFSRKTAAIAYSPRPPARRTASSMLGAPNGKQSAVNGEFETSLGSPTVMDARGMIAVGTQSGRVVVYGFDQEVKCILGSDGMGKSHCH